jgi:hypothetical protein
MAENLDDGIDDDDNLHIKDPGSPLVFKVALMKDVRVCAIWVQE